MWNQWTPSEEAGETLVEASNALNKGTSSKFYLGAKRARESTERLPARTCRQNANCVRCVGSVSLSLALLPIAVPMKVHLV